MRPYQVGDRVFVHTHEREATVTTVAHAERNRFVFFVQDDAGVSWGTDASKVTLLTGRA